ncbi:innate immunity activator protein isoform X2 [Melopsittacus undulatus]|uniref:innate immunity activator protein isoform X2 n=1 Tax=Melopsittacus undulatus TaxID=13146 RepID=UPI00146B40E0|nr:innate immunity activator protein isoform X2 [Melopsittacus undulatus]
MGDASDADSGILLHPAPSIPSWPRAGQQRALEARLDVCVQELRRLCLREAELTGTLPREYPLRAGEKPPQVRRRIGAAFKLDETLVLRGADPVSALERELALQLQIARAARRLCREENIGRRLRRRRQSAALLEEQKLRHLQSILSQRRLLSAHTGTQEHSDDSSLSDTVPLEEEETRTPGPGSPRGDPEEHSEEEEEEEEEGSGSPSEPPSPWGDAGPNRAHEKPKAAGVDAGDGGTRSSRCYPGSPPAPGSPGPVSSPVGRPRDVPPYHLVPIRTLVLCRQAGSSAPGSPEPAGHRGQSQSMRLEGSRAPEPRGRSAAPRRRPTYYTVTVPASCVPRSGSDDSISGLSSVSHATSPGSSSPELPVPPPPVPGYLPRGALPVPVLCEPDPAPLRYQRLVPSHSRIVRTPSLKDYAPVRGVSKATVSEELRSWHQRARLRGARPHSLDRQGAFRGPRTGGGRDLPRVLLPRAQQHPGVPPGWVHAAPTLSTPVAQDGCWHPWVPSPTQGPPPVPVLRRSSDAVSVQVYVPENGEIVTQV